MLAHISIKQSTSKAHAKVDELFSAFDLARCNSYVGFLRAQARAILPLEQLLYYDGRLPWWESRGRFVLQDLEALKSAGNLELPAPVCSGITSHGSRFGVLYVLEGSRFGAAILNRCVGGGLPRAFLSAATKPGCWSGLLTALECAAAQRLPIWLDEVARGASVAFDLFAASAIEELQVLGQPTRAVGADRRSAAKDGGIV